MLAVKRRGLITLERALLLESDAGADAPSIALAGDGGEGQVAS